MRFSNASWPHSFIFSIFLFSPFDLAASLAMDLYLPAVPFMSGALSVGPDFIQLTLTVYMLLLGAGQLVFGPISDCIGRRPVLLMGGAFFVISSFGLALTESGLTFLALRFFQACGASACLVATFATVRDIYAGSSEGSQIYGILGSLLALVPAFGPFLGALIHTYFGWRAIFVILVAFMLIPLTSAFWLWPETRKQQKRQPILRQLLVPLKSLDFWRYTFGYSAGMGAFFVYFSTAPGVMIKRLGLSQLEFSCIFATVALVMLAVARFIGLRVSIWGLRKTLTRAMCCLLSGAFLMALGEVAEIINLFCYMVPMWVAACGIAMAAAVGPNGALKGLDHLAGTATAVYYTLGGLILGIGGTISVLLSPKDTGWPVSAYCFFVPLIVLSLLAKKDRPS